eukprot:COSAG06_NODE_1429_length_9481_cov_30.750986_8_plen_255_part_00
MQQQQPAPSQEEGVPPAAATDAREAQEPPVAEQPAPAPTPTVADDDDAPPAADAPLLPLGDDEFPDIIIAFICRYLGLRELGRLACVARRFTEAMLTEPGGAKLLSPIEEGARLRLEAAAAAGSEDVHSYMTRVGLKAWIGSFEQHLPANIRSVRLVRATTASDLRRMATKANWQLDDATATQVLNALKMVEAAAAERLADETWVRALWRVQYRLEFTSCGPEVVLSEEGALPARAQYPPLRLSFYLLHNSRPL